MKRKPVRVLILCSIFVVLLAAGLSYLRHRFDGPFSRNLAAAVHSGSGSVHLRSLPSPSWQRVYIFGPYTPAEQISAALGFSWSGSAAEVIRSSDSVNLLLFVSDQSVVMSVLHPRNHGDFVPDSVGRNFARDDAEFAIVRRPEDNWIVLKPLSNSRNAPNHALQRTAPRVTVAAVLRPGVFTPSHLFP